MTKPMIITICARSDLFGIKEYFCDNRIDYVSQIQIFPLSAKILSRKPRFTSRAVMVSHLTTHENRESNDDLCQANRFEALFRPTSDDIVPSVERSISSNNQMHYEETLMIETVPRTQSNSFSTPFNSYQGSLTPVASSNRQSPTLFGSTLSPSSQSYMPTKTHLNPLGIKCLMPIKRSLWDNQTFPADQQ